MFCLARVTFWLVWVLRLVQGVVTGLAFPSVYSTLGRWSGSDERSVTMSFAFAAMPLASALNSPITSSLCCMDGGWPNVFYWQGGVAAAWLLLYVLLAHDDPDTHPTITEEERAYLQYDCPSSKKKKVNFFKVPWFSMARCRAVWTLIITHFCSSWVFILCSDNMPSYASEVFKFDLKSVNLGDFCPAFLMTVSIYIHRTA